MKARRVFPPWCSPCPGLSGPLAARHSASASSPSAGLRRTLEIACFHIPGARVDWKIRFFLDRTGAVRVAASDLRWQDWQRYSDRQGRSMAMGGLHGHGRARRRAAPCLPLLRTAEVLHVGKGATFGLGRFTLERYQKA